MFNFKNKFDKVKEKGKGKVAKKFFGLTFNGVRDNKDNTKRKALSLRKKERVMSRGELYASKWCRGMKKRSIKEGEGRERNLVNQGVTVIYIDNKGEALV